MDAMYNSALQENSLSNMPLSFTRLSSFSSFWFLALKVNYKM